ncbi:MAG: insulinase family protein [Acidobacteria bacterium]|nr:insulinase family protein [Acidobacteriota bacterium]
MSKHVLSSLALILTTMATTNLMAAPPILQPGKSPLVTIRLTFRTGAAHEPAGKEGVASLMAAMLTEGGTRKLSYQQVIDAMFPMATEVDSQVDHEMITFSGETHIDNLEKYYALLRDMLLDPGWREEDLRRLKDDAINFLQVSLRGNNDEELGKEILYNWIYEGHPYGRHPAGRVSAIRALTIADLKQFYRAQLTQANLTIAIAGGYPKDFPGRVIADLDKLPKGEPSALRLPDPKPIRGRQLLMVEKKTRSVAMSMGFPIPVRRGHPDYLALLVAQSWLGQHRNSGVRLFDRIRAVRGLNYGDYAYIEYFPRGMFQFEPDPNLARRHQIFQVWIRPVEPATAHFTLRLAIYELERLHRTGLSEDDFDRTRSFLSKYVNLLTRTKRAELGYAVDSAFYGISEYNSYIKEGLKTLTRDQVNAAIRKHLSPDNMKIVLIGENCEALRADIVAGKPSPITYNSPKLDDVVAEDKIVADFPIKIPSSAAKVEPVERFFE